MQRVSVRRTMMVVAFLAAAVGMFATAPNVASAAPCEVPAEYSGGVSISVSPAGPVSPGQTITVNGSGFPPGCDVTISVNGTIVGSAVTDASGSFAFGTTLGNVAGTVTIGVSAGSFSRTLTLQVAGGPALTCTPTTLTFGDAISCTATGFPASVPVAFEINPPLGTANSSASGVATINSTIPAQSTFTGSGCGAQTVTATGGGASASTSVTITCPGVTPTTTSGALPRTGSDNGRLAGLAIAMVAAGGIVVVVARKREHAAA